MVMSNAVQKLADTTPGKEARAMEAFARALRQVRREREREKHHLETTNNDNLKVDLLANLSLANKRSGG